MFERQQIKEMEEKNRADLLDRVQGEAADIKGIPENNPQDTLAKQAAVEQYQATIQKLQNAPPQGRMVIHISSNFKRWMNTSSDVQVRAGDSLYVPKRPSVVLVDGAVYNPTGVTFKPGKSAGWYLSQAGGATLLSWLAYLCDSCKGGTSCHAEISIPNWACIDVEELPVPSTAFYTF